MTVSGVPVYEANCGVDARVHFRVLELKVK